MYGSLVDLRAYNFAEVLRIMELNDRIPIKITIIKTQYLKR